jgi:hypothetical protein
MLVQIKDYDFLYDHKDEGPSVNDHMLGLAGDIFEIQDTEISQSRYYNYAGWSWLGSWLIPASEGRTQTPPAIQAPYDALDLRYLFTSKIDEQVFPDGFEYIEIKDPYIKEQEIIGWFKLTPSESDSRVYIKFTNTSAYNVTPYAAMSYDVFHRHDWHSLRVALFSGEPRAREEDAVQVLRVLAQVFKEHIVPLFETSYRLYYNGTAFDFMNYEHITTSGAYSTEHDIIKSINKSSRFVRHLIRLLYPMKYEQLVDYHFVSARDAVVDETQYIIDLRNVYLRDRLYSRLRAFEQAPDDATVYTCEVTGLRFLSDEPAKVFPLLPLMFEEDICYETARSIVIPRYDVDTRRSLEQYATPLYERDLLSTDAIGVLYDERWVHPDYYEELMHKYESLADDIDNLTYHGGILYEYAGKKFKAYDDEGIEDYDYEPGLDFFGTGDLHLGVELEIDKGGENHKNANIVNGILGFDRAYCMHDGSLNSGFEIATMPMTLDYHMSIKQRYVDAFKAATRLGYKSHDTSTCGIHIHIDRDFFGVDRRTQKLKASYMALVIERNWADIVKFSRRSYSRMDQWARNKKLSGDIYHSDTEDDVIDKFGNKYDDGDKYVMLNTNHQETFELRLFRGTLKPTTYMATLQFVDNLARVIKACPNLAKAQQITFNDIINYRRYDELVAYVESRGIELEGDDI